MSESKTFYKLLFQLAIPIFFTQLLGSLLGIVDTFMVTSLGDDALSSVGAGAQFMMFLNMIQFGLASGFGIYIAQYYGAQDYKNVSKTFLLATTIGLSISTIFVIFSQAMPRTIIELFNMNETPNQTVIEYGISYIRIASISFLTSTIAFGISMLSRGVQKVVVVSIIQSAGILINTILNYILIHGKLGFPEMGVAGAATATLISSALMATASIVYLVLTTYPALQIRIKHILDINRAFVKKLLKTVTPVVFNETFWGLAMTLYLIAYGFIGEQEVGSIYLSNQINSLFWVVTISVANATAIMIGEKLGENQLDTATQWEKRFRKIATILGIIVGGILFIIAPIIVPLFNGLSDEVIDMVIIILRIYAIYAPIKFLNAIFVVGTLRAGGDTRYALISDLGALWIFGVPIAFILSIYSDLPLYVIVAIVNVEEIIKFTLLFIRVLSGKWINNLTTN